MRFSEAYPSRYLKAIDLPQGPVIPVIIEHIAYEEMGEGDAKLVLYFKDKSKGLPLNHTNANTLMAGCGDDTENAIGRTILLYVIDTEYEGEPRKGIRIRVCERKPEPEPAMEKPTTLGRSEPPDDFEPAAGPRLEIDEGDIPY